MNYSRPITEVIQNRFSCRSFQEEPIALEKQRMLREYMKTLVMGPFSTPVRFDLIAAEAQDSRALRGLGTYGFIKGATGFIAGAMCPGKKNLEDFGYQMENSILYATELGIGTCWLGGTFTRSSFAKKIAAEGEERLPAVVAMGLIADEARERQSKLRKQIGADSRFPWETLFFDSRFGAPLSRQQAGSYAVPLEMVRLAPSASNKQPWRVIRMDDVFHFYLQRTPGYRNGWGGVYRLLGVDDLQRVDLGIAMCHFELTARELGLNGRWVLQEPAIDKPDALTEYSVSWIADTK